MEMFEYSGRREKEQDARRRSMTGARSRMRQEYRLPGMIQTLKNVPGIVVRDELLSTTVTPRETILIDGDLYMWYCSTSLCVYHIDVSVPHWRTVAKN